MVAVAAALGAITTVSLALLPGPIDGLRVGAGSAVRNPVGVEGAAQTLEQAFQVSSAALLLLCISGVVARLIGFRSAQGYEREQLKWFIFAMGMLLAGFAINIVTTSTLDEEDVTYHVLAFFVPMVGVLAVPVSIGVAILRYRLYDIDRIINRTLVYGALTAMIAGAYALVALASASFGSSLALFDNDLVVAAATLAVAAAFGPLRRRTQAFVDRRFYRSRYDAARTVEGFSSRLRDSVDLDAVSGDLLATVNRTLQPAHATLWLRGSEEGA